MIGLLGGATVITLVMLVLHLDSAADLWATLDPGGPVLLGLMCLLALPTLVLWTTSVLLGPGFTLGTDTAVDLAGADLGPVPGFPPLAALPDPGPFGGWVVVLTLIPLAAGVAAGLVAYTRVPAAPADLGTRRGRRRPRRGGGRSAHRPAGRDGARRHRPGPAADGRPARVAEPAHRGSAAGGGRRPRRDRRPLSFCT